MIDSVYTLQHLVICNIGALMIGFKKTKEGKSMLSVVSLPTSKDEEQLQRHPKEKTLYFGLEFSFRVLFFLDWVLVST